MAFLSYSIVIYCSQMILFICSSKFDHTCYVLICVICQYNGSIAINMGICVSWCDNYNDVRLCCNEFAWTNIYFWCRSSWSLMDTFFFQLYIVVGCSTVFLYICSGKFDHHVPRLFVILINIIDVSWLLKRYMWIDVI